jgi:hypothetical protein
LSNASIDHSGDAKPRRVRVDDPGSPLHGRMGERVGDDLDHDGKHYVIVLLDGEMHWWSEIRWLDEWFEGLWMDAAAEAGYRLDNEIDFDAHMRSEERSGE